MSFIGQGTSGSGKTASYVICMLRRVDPDLNGVQGICILESIELCFQVLKVFETLGKYTKIRAEVLEKELFPGGVQQFSIQVSLEPTKAEFITEKLLGILDNVRQAIIFGNSDNSFDGYHGLDRQLQRHQWRRREQIFNNDKIQERASSTRGFTPPLPNFEVYLQRAARCGKFGKKGVVFTMVSTYTEHLLMEEYETRFERPITKLSAFMHDEEVKALLEESKVPYFAERASYELYQPDEQKDEIILSVVALGSPQLLMLSIIGPRKQLDALKSESLVKAWLMMLTVKTNITGRTFVLEVEGSNTFDIVKTKIRDMEGIPPNEPALIFEDKVADDDVLSYFDYYYIDWDSDPIPAPPKSPDSMEIFIRTDMMTKFSLEVQKSDTISNVKHKIYEKQRALPYKQRLFFADSRKGRNSLRPADFVFAPEAPKGRSYAFKILYPE
ncbi:polyubiquitin 11-like protein [Tanacetum coccineum]